MDAPNHHPSRLSLRRKPILEPLEVDPTNPRPSQPVSRIAPGAHPLKSRRPPTTKSLHSLIASPGNIPHGALPPRGPTHGGRFFSSFRVDSPTAVRRIPGSGFWAMVYLSTQRAIFVRAAVFGAFPRATHSRRQAQFLVAVFYFLGWARCRTSSLPVQYCSFFFSYHARVM